MDMICCKPESIEIKKTTNWSRIYYADYETDIIVSPHKPYLCCVCTDDEFRDFTGPNLSSRFLNSLHTNSLIYFHNLKYDGCFFINEPGWETQITQRNVTLLQVVMDRCKIAQIIDKKTKKPIIDPKTKKPKTDASMRMSSVVNVCTHINRIQQKGNHLA